MTHAKPNSVDRKEEVKSIPTLEQWTAQLQSMFNVVAASAGAVASQQASTIIDEQKTRATDPNVNAWVQNYMQRNANKYRHTQSPSYDIRNFMRFNKNANRFAGREHKSNH